MNYGSHRVRNLIVWKVLTFCTLWFCAHIVLVVTHARVGCYQTTSHMIVFVSVGLYVRILVCWLTFDGCFEYWCSYYE